MRNGITCGLVALLILLRSSVAYSADKTPRVTDPHRFEYYWEKGNRGEKISPEDFNILMSELQEKLKELKAVFSRISIAGAGFSYDVGKGWEEQLDTVNKRIERALECVNVVANRPDSMAASLFLYLFLADIKTYSLSFCQILQFTQILSPTHYVLDWWALAFQKAHLIPLAITKDERAGQKKKPN